MLCLFIGRWLLRAWLAVPAAAVALWAVVRRRPVQATFGPALGATFADDYQFETDGPGFSDEQLPRLWSTCRTLAEKLGCPPPDALHVSIEPGCTLAWSSRIDGGAVRRHVCVSVMDLRLLSADEGRAVLAHELVHVGFDHAARDHLLVKIQAIADALGVAYPLVVSWPVRLAAAVHRLGLVLTMHDAEKEADRRAAAVVGGNHVARALQLTYLHGPTLEPIFRALVERSTQGHRAPQRLAEATVQLYRGYDFSASQRVASRDALEPGPAHPSLPERVDAAQQHASRPASERSFVEAYPELVAIEEQLTRTYFPETPVHQRSNASPLRRKALAARLRRPHSS